MTSRTKHLLSEERSVETVETEIDRLAGAESDPPKALEAKFLGHVDFVARHPGAPRMQMGKLQHERMTSGTVLHFMGGAHDAKKRNS